MSRNPPLSQTPNGTKLAAIVLALVVAVTSGCQSDAGAPEELPSVQPTAVVAVPSPSPTAPPNAGRQPIAGGPILLRDDITLRQVVDVGGGNVKLAPHPLTGELHYLNPGNGIYRVALDSPATASQVLAPGDIITDGLPSGMAFGPDGALFVVVNRRVGENLAQAVIRKGMAAASGSFTWETLASTEPYPLSGTQFDHLFNGIVVSPDGQWVFVNSGSRTDHGEVQDNSGAFPDAREVALTAKILRIPANAVDLVLPNDEAELTEQGLIFAWGTRNAYDLAFAPNGDLFAVDNGPDADYPDELNWLREGQHYGFPWRFGIQDNPQQFADYDSSQDPRLHPDFMAVSTGTYHNDPDFPKPPGPFIDPLANLGPDAAQYRGDDGLQHDAAAEDRPLYTFTPHRSPLGLVFITAADMPADLRGDGGTLSAFVLSWGAAGGTLTDRGQDLLHLKLTKQGDHYESVTTQIAREFKSPIDAVMIENRLYVLEFGADGASWELTFE